MYRSIHEELVICEVSFGSESKFESFDQPVSHERRFLHVFGVFPCVSVAIHDLQYQRKDVAAS